MSDLEALVSQAENDFSAAADAVALEQVKARFLGKSGSLTELLKGLGKLDPDARKTAGAAINIAKQKVEAALEARREALRHAALEARLAEESLDVTLPGRGHAKGVCIPLPARSNASKPCSAASVSMWRMARRSRPTFITSLR